MGSSLGRIDITQPVNMDHPLARGLVSWWRVVPDLGSKDRLRDLVVKSRNNGTLTSMSYPATATSGMAVGTSRRGGDGEIRFDGTNDYVLFQSVPPIQDTTPFSMSFVLRINTTAQQPIVSSFNNYPNVKGFVIETSPGTANGELSLDLLNANSTAQRRSRGTRNLADGVAHHCVVVSSGNASTTGHFYYIDGASDTTVSITNQNPGTLDNVSFWLGRWTFGYATLLAVDDLQYYNRALSSTEVVQLYQSSLLGHPKLLRRTSTKYYSIPITPPPGGTRVRIIGSGFIPMVI